MNPLLGEGAPPETLVTCHQSGWMQLELFEQWFDHFLKYTNSSKENSSLFIIDRYKTHTQNVNVIDKARDHGVVLLCLPPHCSHRLQALGVSFMYPLSTFYNQEIEKWLRNNPGNVVTLYQVASLFGHACTRASTTLNAANSFNKCGIHPVDRNIFTDDQFG